MIPPELFGNELFAVNWMRHGYQISLQSFFQVIDGYQMLHQIPGELRIKMNINNSDITGCNNDNNSQDFSILTGYDVATFDRT